MLKENIASFFLSKINVDLFSRMVKGNPLLGLPYKYISQRIIDYNFPQHLFIEATSACNLSCDICVRNTNKQRIGFMEMTLFKRIIDEAIIFGRRSFCLHVFGEPLLSPNIILMLEYIKYRDPKNVILLTTNGVLLDEKAANGIIDAGVDRLVVSVLTADAKKYESITGVNNLKKVEDNILNSISLKKSKKKRLPNIYVRMIKNEITESTEELFRKKWAKLNVSVDVRPAHNYAGKIKNNSLKSTVNTRYPCYHLWFSPAVSFDGDVSICCCDWNRDAVLGNLNKESLADIWRGEKLKVLRLRHLRGEYQKIPLCHKCDVWNTYPDIFFKWQKAKKTERFIN